MKNLVKIFENAKQKKIRVVYLEGVPYFVAVDVAKALGYKDLSGAIRKNVDDEDKKFVDLNRVPENQAIADAISKGWIENLVVLINESGLWSLILRSRLEDAKEIKRWVTSEVLPSIRQTGSYTVESATPTDSKKFENACNFLDKFTAFLKECAVIDDKALRDQLIKTAFDILKNA